MKIGTTNKKLKPKVEFGDNLLMGKVTTTDKNIIDKSIVISKYLYPMIPPNLGTIGFFIKKSRLVPEDIIQILRSQGTKRDKRKNFDYKERALIHINEVWDLLDEFSKQRFDIFDHLARRALLTTEDLWGILLVKLANHGVLATKTAMTLLELNKLELISKVGNKVGENDNADKLMAEMTGLKKNETNINVQNNQNQINLNERPSFSKLSNSLNKVLMEEMNPDLELESKEEQKQLTEGNLDYVDSEIIENEKEDERLLIQ